jgi:hypothetical protein
MIVRHLIRVGALTAQSAINEAAVPADLGAAELRVGVLAFLASHAGSLSAESREGVLLDAYRNWLEVAGRLYRTGDQTLIREYMHRGAILSAELELAEAGPEGNVDAAAESA